MDVFLHMKVYKITITKTQLFYTLIVWSANNGVYKNKLRQRKKRVMKTGKAPCHRLRVGIIRYYFSLWSCCKEAFNEEKL